MCCVRFDYAYYQELLAVLLKGRASATFDALCNRTTDPFFLLRHDIDYGLDYVGDMPKMEAALGIRATYFIQISSIFYNPFEEKQRTAIREIERLGHRFGLHANVSGGDEMPEMDFVSEVCNEVEVLKKLVKSVDAVSFHQPTPRIIQNKIKIPFVNTYDRKDMEGIEYFSDSSQVWSKGDPVSLVRSNPKVSYQVLVHPALWSAQHKSFCEMAKATVLDKGQALYDYLRRFGRGIEEDLVCVFNPAEKVTEKQKTQ